MVRRRNHKICWTKRLQKHTYQILWPEIKAVFRGRFIVLNANGVLGEKGKWKNNLDSNVKKLACNLIWFKGGWLPSQKYHSPWMQKKWQK